MDTASYISSVLFRNLNHKPENILPTNDPSSPRERLASVSLNLSGPIAEFDKLSFVEIERSVEIL